MAPPPDRSDVVKLANSEKSDYVDNVLYPTNLAFLPTILFPILSALALIFLYPIPARYVFKHVRSEQKKLKEIQRTIEDETPITQEEAAVLRASLRKATRDFETELSNPENVITKLKSDLELAERRTSASADFEMVLDAEQTNALVEISKDGTTTAEYLHEKLNLDSVAFDHIIDELKRFSFIKDWEENDIRFLGSTAEGRAYLIKSRSSPRQQA